MKPDNAYNPNPNPALKQTEVGFALNNSPVRNLNLQTQNSPLSNAFSPMPDLVGDDLKPLTLKERLMR
jgi:hypothetical protein